MSVSSIAHGISSFFNWLASEPKRHWTLRELLPALTDNALDIDPPRPINRVARVIERIATVGGITGGVIAGTQIYGMGLAAGIGYMTALAHAVLPMLIVPLLAVGAAWVVGGVATMAINKAAETANSFENWLGDSGRRKEYDLKQQGKAEMPKTTLPKYQR